MIYENYYGAPTVLPIELEHHGIKGQKWGVRRFQNPDGTLTEAGKKRYGTIENFNKTQHRKDIAKKVAIGAGVAGAAIGGAYLYNKYGKTIGPEKSRQNLLKNAKETFYTDFDKRKSMTDDQLLERIGRLEKEKRLMELERYTDDRKNAVAKTILRNAGRVTAGTIISGAALYGGKKTIKYAANILGFDGDKIVREMFPKKK